jgi:hypothetical protein
VLAMNNHQRLCIRFLGTEIHAQGIVGIVAVVTIIALVLATS